VSDFYELLKSNAMKFLLLLFLPVAVLSQRDTYGLPLIKGSVVYQEVVNLNGVPKEIIYNKARQLANDRFDNTTEIMFVKKQDGRITSSGNVDINFRNEAAKLVFRVGFQVRDGKYLLSIDNIELASIYNTETIHTRIEEQLLYAIERRMQSTIAILTKEDAAIKKEIEYIKEMMSKKEETAGR
jgi:hypothetical protein